MHFPSGIGALLNHPTAVSIQAGINVAISTASLCIVRRLYKIAAMKPMMTTRVEKRREVMIDLLIGIGIPILEMIFSKCIQSSHFRVIVYTGATKVGLFRPMFTTYSRISVLTQLFQIRH